MRMGLFALLATACLLLGGCGDTKTTPPPGTDTETPDLSIDQGGAATTETPATDDASKKE